MAYGQALGVSAPTVSVTAGPTYATQINAYLSALAAVVEAKVTPAGMDISSDLSFLSGGSYQRVKDLKGASFHIESSALSAATYPSTVFFTGANGDFYVNDGAGNQIRMTASGQVNVSTTGGITGAGYGTGGVEVNWDGSGSYHLYSGAGTYTDLTLDDLKFSDGSTNTLTVSAPAMAADYTLTLPAAVAGGAGYLVTMDGSGNLGTTNTPSVNTLAASGLITAAAGLTAAANQHVTISGTGRYKHGELTKYVSAAAGVGEAGTGWEWVASGRYCSAPAATETFSIPIEMVAGQRIKAVDVHITDVVGATIDYRLVRVVSGTATAVASSDTTGTGVYAAWGLGALTETAAANTFYTVDVTPNDAASTNARLWGVTITYDWV